MKTTHFPVEKTDEEWRRQLTPEQYAVLRGHGTERPGSCALLNEHRSGTFTCVACGQRLLVPVAAGEWCAPRSTATTAVVIWVTCSRMVRRRRDCGIASMALP